MQFLVAVDGSAESDRTLDYVLDLADAMADSPAVTVVHSADPEVYTTGEVEPVADLEIGRASCRERVYTKV